MTVQSLQIAGALAIECRERPSLVSLRHLSVSYEDGEFLTPVIEDLSLEVREGEFVAILGPSGCGKSTLLKVLTGLIGIDKGSALFRNNPIVGPHRDVGVVFQAPTLLPWKTVLENVALPGKLMKLDPAWTERRARELLDMVGLTGFADVLPNKLSGGMAQRVGIARGLLHDPALLLLDEPFGALDAMTREKLNLELASIWQKTGKTIVFITHSISEAVFLADRVVVMAKRPTHVADIVEVKLDHPRAPEVMTTGEFGKYTAHLRGFFNSSGVL